jgi:hypothetical protein
MSPSRDELVSSPESLYIPYTNSISIITPVATRARESEGISMMSVMLVSYGQGAKGNKGVSYYDATL